MYYAVFVDLATQCPDNNLSNSLQLYAIVPNVVMSQTESWVDFGVVT